MKDAVKITVIATGFREVRPARQRPTETHMSFSSSHNAALDDPMDFPDGEGPRHHPGNGPEHIMSSEPAAFENNATNDRGYADDVVPVPMAHVSDRMAGEVVSLDGVRDNLRSVVVQNFEQDDLDVPAFLRKRNEVM